MSSPTSTNLTFLQNRVKERGLHYAIPVAVACIGFIVCLATSNAQARYGASFIYVGGMYIANPLIMGYVSGKYTSNQIFQMNSQLTLCLRCPR